MGKTAGVVTRFLVFSRLRQVAKTFACRFQYAVGSYKARHFRRFPYQAQPHIDRDPMIIEQDSVQIWHVAPVMKTEYGAHGGSRTWRFVPVQRIQHSANQVDHQISAHARSIILPAAPARETLGIEGDLR